jgi:cell division protein FtsW
MAKRVSVDRILFVVTLLLVFVGLVMVFSASAVMAKERYHSGYFFLLRQLGWAVAGFIAMLAGMRIDYKRLKHPGVVFSLLGLTTLMLISVFFLDRAHNTHRWIHFSGFSFQLSWRSFLRTAQNRWTTGGTRSSQPSFQRSFSSV